MIKIILVDSDDNEIGSEEKIIVHQKGLLHRAFSVFIIDDGYLLLQKRAEEKYHSPGLWSNSCCGHPNFGENINEAASRRLFEELGIKTSLRKFSTTMYKVQTENLVEHEYNHLFIGNFSKESVINPNVQEVSEYKWMKFDEIFPREKIYTPWFHIIFEKLKFF